MPYVLRSRDGYYWYTTGPDGTHHFTDTLENAASFPSGQRAMQTCKMHDLHDCQIVKI